MMIQKKKKKSFRSSSAPKRLLRDDGWQEEHMRSHLIWNDRSGEGPIHFVVESAPKGWILDGVLALVKGVKPWITTMIWLQWTKSQSSNTPNLFFRIIPLKQHSIEAYWVINNSLSGRPPMMKVPTPAVHLGEKKTFNSYVLVIYTYRQITTDGVPLLVVCLCKRPRQDVATCCQVKGILIWTKLFSKCLHLIHKILVQCLGTGE